MVNGEPPKLTIQSPWFYGAPEYDEKKRSMRRFPGWRESAAFSGLSPFAMGWIIRGFAGIPTGQDFKPAKRKNENS